MSAAAMLAVASSAVSCIEKEPDEGEVKVSSITLNPDSMSLKVGESATIKASVEPSSASRITVTWTSSDSSVATVDNGTVTAIAAGAAVVTAKAGDKSADCLVRVTESQTPPEPELKLTLNLTEVELEEFGSVQLVATMEPGGTPAKKVDWSSSDTNVAIVDYNGHVTAFLRGSATITAAADNQTATCIVKVLEPASLIREKAALLAFYKANNGENWKFPWYEDDRLDSWHGIRLTPDGKHVSAIHINDNVYGYLPKELGELTELEELTIDNESGKNPNPGPIPEEIGNLKNLKSIYFWDYDLSGTLPEALFGLKELETLAIKHARSMDAAPLSPSVGNLTNLTELSLFDCNLSGTLPNELGNLTALEELYLADNNLSGPLPACIGSLINLKRLNLSVNPLTGPIPSSYGSLENFWYMWPEAFAGCSITQEDIRAARIPAPKSPKIKTVNGDLLDLEEEFAKNQYTVLYTFDAQSGNALEFLGQLAELYKVNKDKGLGVITAFNNNSTEQNRIDERDGYFVKAHQDVGADWKYFIRHMYDDYPEGAPYYSETGVSMYPGGWEFSVVVIGPERTIDYSSTLSGARTALQEAMEYLQELFKYTPTHYESKDYAHEGKVTTLQTASEGNGIDLVITGDAFSDRQLMHGLLKDAATFAMDSFFAVEPMKSMKNRFNVYLVEAVSKNEEYFNGCSTAFSGAFGNGSAVGGDNAKVLQYAAKAVNSSRMDNVVVLVVMNSQRSGGTTYMMDPEKSGVYAGGASVVWVPMKIDSPAFDTDDIKGTIIHEAAGHGLAKLADEYAYRDLGEISSSAVDYARSKQKQNWYLNVDFTDDPAKVLWSNFIGDEAFASENIGVYQGGYVYWSGVWRPTEQSVMNNNRLYHNFNAPSRSQIYTRIMKLSEGESWNYSYDEFVKWDKAHPTAKLAPKRADGNTSHVPPVPVKKTWKQVSLNR